MKIFNEAMFSTFPDAILLDLDNTLYDYEAPHQSGLQGASQRAQRIFGLDHTSFIHSFEEGKSLVKKQLKHAPASHHRLLYFLRMTELVGGSTNPIAALDLEQAYWSAYLAEAKLHPYVREFLETLRSLAVPLILITNLNAHIQLRKLLYFQIEDFFDFVVTSEEAGADKPDPAPFRLALSKLPKPPQKVWMIGDDPISDIRGAKEAIDAAAIQWKTANCPVSKEADALFHKWSDLLSYVEKMASVC